MDVVIDFTEEKEGSTNLSLSLSYFHFATPLVSKEGTISARETLSVEISFSTRLHSRPSTKKILDPGMGLARSTKVPRAIVGERGERANRVSRWHLVGSLHSFVTYA